MNLGTAGRLFECNIFFSCLGAKNPEMRILNFYLGVEPKIGGKTPEWMVKIMKNPIKMDDLGV